MDNAEYKMIKKGLIARYGADDAESLCLYSKNMERIGRWIKWCAIAMALSILPLCFIFIGLLFLPIWLPLCALTYFLGDKYFTKKAKRFREHVMNDPNLSAA